jgi:hypothetical protein
LEDQSGFVLIMDGFDGLPKPGMSLSIADDAISYVIQSVSGTYTDATSELIIVLAQEKVAASADNAAVHVRKDYSQIRLTGHDFLNIGTGGITTTNYPGTPSQPPAQGNETNETFPGRVYYVSTDQDGNFRVGEYFRIDQATGRATLNASAFDLAGLTSLRLGSIGAQLGETINEFSADATLSGGSNSAVPTEYAVKTYVDAAVTNLVDSAPSTLNTLNELALALGSDANFSTTVTSSIATKASLAGATFTGPVFGTSLTLSGDLTVNGTTTTVNSTELVVADKNITVASGAADATAADGAGITIDGASATIIYTSATDTWNFNKPVSGTYTSFHPQTTSVTVSSTATISLNKPTHLVTLSGATTISVSDGSLGRMSILYLDTAASGFVPTFSNFSWPDATEPSWGDARYWIISMFSQSGSVVLASATGHA